MTDKKATLSIEGRADAVELPIRTGTLGPDVIDVASLTGNGVFTFDPGFTSTASCESKITFIDGNAGVLLHRGYPIDDLAQIPPILRLVTSFLTESYPTPRRKPILKT